MPNAPPPPFPREDALARLRSDKDAQLAINASHIQRLLDRRAKAGKEQRVRIDESIDVLRDADGELEQLFLDGVERITDIQGVLADFDQITARMQREAKVTGGVLTTLRVGKALGDATRDGIGILKGAPKSAG